VTVIEASVVLTASVFRFSEVSLQNANRWLKERAIPVVTQGEYNRRLIYEYE